VWNFSGWRRGKFLKESSRQGGVFCFFVFFFFFFFLFCFFGIKLLPSLTPFVHPSLPRPHLLRCSDPAHWPPLCAPLLLPLNLRSFFFFQNPSVLRFPCGGPVCLTHQRRRPCAFFSLWRSFDQNAAFFDSFFEAPPMIGLWRFRLLPGGLI